MAYWKPIRGILDPIPIRKFDGVYKPDDLGFNLPDGLFTELINFSPEAYPALKTRPGHSVLGTFGTRVLGFGAWKESELHAVFNDGTWRKYDGTNWTTLKSGLNTSADWSFCNFQGNLSTINLIGANGIDPILRYDGVTVQALANAPAGGNYIDTQSNRLYCAVGSVVKFSALRKADDWTTVDDAGEIVYETSSGEPINGLNAGNGNVTAFKSSSIRELYGKGPGSYAFEPVAADIGVTGNQAVTVNDNLIPMISRDGIYLYAGGLRPKKDFSMPVNNFVLEMNKAQLTKCVAGADGKYLYFGIPYDGSTENSRILQYDPNHSTWYTWDGITVTHMLRIGDDFYMGDASGRVLRIGGTTDGGAAITATAIKLFTLGSLARKQQWFKLYVIADIPVGSSLSVYVSPEAEGNSSWVLAKTVTGAAGVQYQKVLVPTNSIANANSVRIKLVATGPVTIHEITRQIREMPWR